MKKIFGSFTFLFLLLGLILIYMHQVGQDSFSIILIGINPILSLVSESELGSNIMNSGMKIPCNTVEGSISVYWYIGTVVTFVLYGILADFIRANIIKYKLNK